MHKRAKLRLDIASRIAGGRTVVESPRSTVEWAWQRAGMLIEEAEAWSLELETAEAGSDDPPDSHRSSGARSGRARP